jgi:hypothetical protein
MKAASSPTTPSAPTSSSTSTAASASIEKLETMLQMVQQARLLCSQALFEATALDSTLTPSSDSVTGKCAQINEIFQTLDAMSMATNLGQPSENALETRHAANTLSELAR